MKGFEAPLAVVTHLLLLAALGVRSQVVPTAPRRTVPAAPAAAAAAAPPKPLTPPKAGVNVPRGAAAATAARGAVLASATTGAQTLRTVDAALCKPFLVKGLFVSGCTDIDSPQGSEPWCAVGTEKVLCSRATIPERSVRLSDDPDASAPCDYSTVVVNRGVVYGCFATENGQPLKCKSGARGLQPCLTLRSVTAAPSEESKSGPKPAVIAGIAAGAVIPLALGLVFLYYRRRGRARKRVGTTAVSKGYKDMPSSNISSPVDDTEAGGGGGMTPIGMPRARASSVFFNDPRATLLTDRGGVDVTRRLPTSLGKYVIAATYSPTLEDEINIQAGDIVEVYQEFDDGWCSAVNLSRGLTRGVFPMHCIDERVGRIDDNFEPSPR